ncbi:hypothetical protein C4566_01815 [Candidatus Parcubacteria bacterium]|nr:MAG: hypothetical protein C4566_01815 [Candidatus Parcubacteria bacterium]
MGIKRILLLVAFVVFVLGMAFALYWVFFKSPALPGDDLDNVNGSGALPGIGEGNISVISTTTPDIGDLPWKDLEDKISPTANGGLTKVTKVTEGEIKGLESNGTDLKFYNADSKQFYKIGVDGKAELLTDKKFYNVDKVSWSDKGDKAVLEYPDGSNILYNFETGKQVTLPIELQDFSFNRAGANLAAEWIDASGNDDNNWLVLVSEDGGNIDLIEPLGDQAADTAIGFSPDNQIAALYRDYLDLQRQEIFPIGLHDENFNSFVVQGAGFTSEWSPSGQSLVYSIYNKESDYLPTLWVTQGDTNTLGQVKVSLNLNTWPDKCTFSGDNVMYCAVPRGLPRGAGLYPEIAESYNDTFYRVDLNSGVQTLVADPIGDNLGYNAHNLFISGNVLYFTDQNGDLQSINLQ